MTSQLALRLAEESLKRFGFVVVGYRPEVVDVAMGKKTTKLWKVYEMPQPFVPIRKATREEWANQVALACEIFNTKPTPAKSTVPLVLVTD